MRGRGWKIRSRCLTVAVTLVSAAACLPASARAAVNYVPTPLAVDTGHALSSVTCPSATECVAATGAQELSFDPLNFKRPAARTLFSGRGLVIEGLWCASATSCLGIDAQSAAVFNPRNYRAPVAKRIEPVTGEGMVSLRCPARGECVAIDSFGDAMTYDPLTGKAIRKPIKVAGNERLTALACPSITECTALDDDGSQVSFQPLTGKRLSGFQIDKAVGLDAPSGDSDNELDGVSCSSSKLCAAVDTLGNLITFDPLAQASMATAQITTFPIDPGNSLAAISCKRSGICAAVDRQGNAIGGSASSGSWQLQAIPGAQAFSAVACATSSECIAVDGAGNAFRLPPAA